MSHYNNATVDNGKLYVLHGSRVYAYIVSSSSWSRHSDSPTYNCPLVIIYNLLSLIGGLHCGTITNKVFSLSEESTWTETFPPMPTAREGSTAMCTGTALIVAGGRDRHLCALQGVEVLNTDNHQWSAVADLPVPVWEAPAAICGDFLYILRESNMRMYTCSITGLIKSHRSILSSLRNKVVGLWKEVTSPPVTDATYVCINDQLVAIGGKDSNKKTVKAIFVYYPTTDSWKVISQMATPRWACIAAVLPGNMDQLMVIGGYTNKTLNDSVEVATIE